MGMNSRSVENRKDELLNIFIKDEDKKGHDLLAMSNFLEICIGKIEEEISTNMAWEIYYDINEIVGKIAAAIKTGFDISEMGMLVADYSHFSQEIIEGLKKGIYHIGQSRETYENFRPAILDKNKKLVKFFTLKKAINPSSVLFDISTLSMQVSLQKISAQIEEIRINVKCTTEFVRRETLSSKFFYARDRIMSAITVDEDKRERFLEKADEYLAEGLNDLYMDIDDNIEKLAKLNGPFASIKEIDLLLSYINEDMQLIPRYVGLRIYLFNYRNKTEDAIRILNDYCYQLQNLVERKIENSKYTAVELIHKNYPYDVENMDFWLKNPKKILGNLEQYEIMLGQKGKDIYYIDMEEVENE